MNLPLSSTLRSDPIRILHMPLCGFLCGSDLIPEAATTLVRGNERGSWARFTRPPPSQKYLSACAATETLHLSYFQGPTNYPESRGRVVAGTIQ